MQPPTIMAYKRTSPYQSRGRRLRRRNTFVSTAVGVVGAAAKAYSKYRQRKKETTHVAHSGPTCTTRTVYAKKRMPYKKRKNWTNFSRKVKAVDLSTLPKSTFRTHVIDRMTTGYGVQSVRAFCFKPGDGDESCNDVASLNQYSSDALGFNLASNKSAADRQAYDFQNNGPKVASFIFELRLSNLLPSQATIEMYEVVARRDITRIDQMNERALFNQMILNHSNMATALAGGDDQPSWTRYGITPFDMKEFTTQFQIKKVSTINLPGNGSCDRMWREPRDCRLGMNRYQEKLMVRGDRMLVLIQSGPAGLNGSAGAWSTPTDVIVNVSRTYKWSMDGYNFSTIKQKAVQLA